MSLSSFFSFGLKSAAEMGNSELEQIFPLRLTEDVFIESDILHTYLKILTDTFERTHGLKKEMEPALWDNCLQSEANQGLVSHLAESMTKKTDLFLVYKAKVLRVATDEEKTKIREDYKKSGESKVGIFVSFKKYRRTDMLQIYSSLEYCILSSLHKSVKIAKAVQIKIKELRSSVSLGNSAVAIEQAKSLASALRNGNDILLDREDEVTTTTPDISPTEKAILFLDNKRAFVLGLPMAYISGEQTGGMGASGEQDARAVEQGLKQYFVSIVQPVCKALFGVEVEFKSQDFRQISTALEVLKAFDLASDENMSQEAKREIIARVFDLDPDEEAKALEKEAAEREKELKENPPPENDPNNPPPPNGGPQPVNNARNRAAQRGQA